MGGGQEHAVRGAGALGRGLKWTVCFWRSRAAPAEGGPMCPASPTGRARGLTWRLCRAGVQPPGPGSCPPHRRRRPAGPALWHRSEAAGERPGPRPRTPQALALPASAELGRARGTPPAGAAHTPTRQEVCSSQGKVTLRGDPVPSDHAPLPSSQAAPSPMHSSFFWGQVSRTSSPSSWAAAQ